MTSDKFVGYLVSIECKNTFYQGIVTRIDSNNALIQLKNCFQNGLHLGNNKLVDIKTTDIDNIEILADPPNALSLLKPKMIDDPVAPPPPQPPPPQQQMSKSQSEDIKNLSSNKPRNNNNNLNNQSPTNYNEQQMSFNKRRNAGGNYNHNSTESNFTFTKINTETIKNDFDFETNLALFDKNAFYEEMEGHSRPKEEPVSAFESIIKNISLSNNNNNQNEITSMHSDSNVSSFKQEKLIYHQISVANLFSSTIQNPNPTTSNSSTSSYSSSSSSHSSNNVSSSSSSNNNNNNNNKNYRFDEMVLDTGEPINLKQIQIPQSSRQLANNKQYVTDDGFIIPCIDINLRKSLFEQSFKNGHTLERQIECMGRCCADMALQLVGGPIRFSPKNNHQKPAILVMANCTEIQGLYAICASRLLTNKTVKVYLFLVNYPVANSSSTSTCSSSSCSLTSSNSSFSSSCSTTSSSSDDDINNHSRPHSKRQKSKNKNLLKQELELFKSSDPSNFQILTNVEEIKNIRSVDLIINGLESPECESNTQIWYRNLVKYIDQFKASIVSIDPCINGSAMQSKWCLLPVLPLSMSPKCGRVYLCDLGFTQQMFQSVNIKYQSPFGAKFLIPLHND